MAVSKGNQANVGQLESVNNDRFAAGSFDLGPRGTKGHHFS